MLDRVDSWVVVMFVDFGRSATIPVQSLRTLDGDNFWTIPPLTQPFMLEKGKAPSTLLQRTQGTVDAVRSSGHLSGNGFCVGAAKAPGMPSLQALLFWSHPSFQHLPLAERSGEFGFHTWSLRTTRSGRGPQVLPEGWVLWVG